MRKSNIFLRTALLLLIGIIATSGVFVGSDTYSKYIAQGTVNAQARVAKFLVQVQMYTDAASTKTGWQTFSTSTGAPAAIFGTASVPLEKITEDLYELNPLNSYPGDSAGPVDTSVLEGESAGHNNPKHVDAHDGTIIGPGTGGRFRLEFNNMSEVAVRFYLDDVNSSVQFGTKTAPGTAPTTTSFTTAITNFPIGYQHNAACIADGNTANCASGTKHGCVPAPANYPNNTIANAKIQFSTNNVNWYDTLGGALTHGGAATHYIDLAPNTSSAWNNNSVIYWRWRFSSAGALYVASNAQDQLDTALGVASAYAQAAGLDATQAWYMHLKLQFSAVQLD